MNMQREIAYDDVFDAQQHYRILLDSMSRPGKINRLPHAVSFPPAGINPASALAGFALLNTDVSFCALGPEAGGVTRYLSLNTSSRAAAGYEQADFIFLSSMQEGKELQGVKTGTLPYPEEGATVVADAEEISDGRLDGGVGLVLKGPGVDGEKKIYVRGLHPAVLQALQEQNLEFPLGIDAIITDKEHRIFCIPRSTRFSFASE